MIFPNDFDPQTCRSKLTTGCETMIHLLHGLRDSKGRVAGEVHAIRKLGKSLRGGFSMFGLKKSAALEIRGIGRLLSDARDAVSRRNTWNKVVWNADPILATAIADLLDQQTHSSARRPPQTLIDWCVGRVAAACAELNGLPAESLAANIAKGLEKMQRKTLKRCRRMNRGEGADFHNTRKALKAWQGAIEFLPDGMISLDPMLPALAELLGDENDLKTLMDWLENHGFVERFAQDLWKSLRTTRRMLQKQAIRNAATLSPMLPG